MDEEDLAALMEEQDELEKEEEEKVLAAARDELVHGQGPLDDQRECASLIFFPSCAIYTALVLCLQRRKPFRRIALSARGSFKRWASYPSPGPVIRWAQATYSILHISRKATSTGPPCEIKRIMPVDWDTSPRRYQKKKSRSRPQRSIRGPGSQVRRRFRVQY